MQPVPTREKYPGQNDTLNMRILFRKGEVYGGGDFQMNPSETVGCFNLVENENNFFPINQELEGKPHVPLDGIVFSHFLKIDTIYSGRRHE